MKVVKNTLANLLASFMGPLLAIFLTPFYIRHLGLEGYGLVGFFSAFAALLGIVSAAMGKIYLREVAGRTAQQEQRKTVPAMFQNFFAFFTLLGVLVAVVIALFSWWISHRWVHLEHLDPTTVQACIFLIAITLAGTFPTGVCVDTLFALQEQVLANKITMAISLLTTAIASLLVYISHSVLAYYTATTIGTVATLFVMMRQASRSLAGHLEPNTTWPTLAQSLRECGNDTRKVAQSSLALMWTEGAGVAITQTDRMLISSLLPLSSLGLYGIGASVGRLVQITCNAFLVASFPGLCQKVAASPRSPAGAREAFRQQAIVLVLACAIGLPLCAIPMTLLQLWIGKAEIAASAAGITVIFTLAYACLALAAAPYNLAVASGHTRHAALVNTAAAIWYPLLGYWLISRYGLLGAGLLWLTYCAHVFLACTIVAITRINPIYCTTREAAKALCVPLFAVVLGNAVRAVPSVPGFPVLSQLCYSGTAALLVLLFGLSLVLGYGKFTALCSRLWHIRRPAPIAAAEHR